MSGFSWHLDWVDYAPEKRLLNFRRDLEHIWVSVMFIDSPVVEWCEK